MRCPALTGISPETIRELKFGKPRTLELQSTHNVITLGEVAPGSHIFMTHIDRDDLTTGDSGIMVEVLAVSLTMKRIVEFSGGNHFEERERLSARIKVRYCCNSTVKSLEQGEMFTPMRIDVLKCGCFHAG
jgi:uncharacterized protein